MSMKQSTTRKKSKELTGKGITWGIIYACIYGHNIARPCALAECILSPCAVLGASRVACVAFQRGAAADTCWSVSRYRVDLAVCSPTAPTRTKHDGATPAPSRRGSLEPMRRPCGCALSLSLSLSFSVSLTHSLAHCSPCTAPWILRRGEVLRVARSSGQARNDGIHCTAAISTREQRGAAHARSSLVPGVVHAAASVTAAPARLL
jgi:hypothetical protein